LLYAICAYALKAQQNLTDKRFCCKIALLGKEDMFLIVGLGNVGKEYDNTNHNVGFMVADQLADELDTFFARKQCRASVAETVLNGEKIVMAKPHTYMNLSGESVREFVQKFKIPLENVIIVLDDIDLDVGVVRYRPKGSAGTHNGLRSIVACLGTSDFKRVRIGIGKGHPSQDLADYVLSKISKQDKPLIEEACTEAVGLIIETIKQTQKQPVGV